MHWEDVRLPSEFWTKAMPEPNSGCWLWIGALVATDVCAGYGCIRRKGVTRLAHRMAYIAEYGRPHRTAVLDHRCRTSNCVNPAHLEAVSQAENVRRGTSPKLFREANEARRLAALHKTHCSAGHELTSENTALHRVVVRGKAKVHRLCRVCINIAQRKRRKCG